MANRGYITYKGDPETLARDLRVDVKSALQEIVEKWHDDTLQVHFTDTGRRKYRYRSRTQKYRRRKLKTKGHCNPLVYSGDLKRDATRRFRVSGTSKSARITMTVPWYATKRFHRFSTYADEMTRVAQDEVDKMAKITQVIIVDKINRRKNSAPTKTR